MIPGIKILLLEDSPFDIEIIIHAINKDVDSAHISVATDKASYLNLLEAGKPDIIVSDHRLPGFNSISALSIARGRYPGIPFVMLTGALSEEVAVEILKSGADDFILKDRLARLPSAISHALKRYKDEQDKEQITERIIESENNLKAIFENTSEGFLLIDRTGIVKAVNNIAGEFGFFIKGKAIRQGDQVMDFVEILRKDIFNEFLSKALSGDTIEYARNYTKKDGNERWIEFVIRPVVNDQHVEAICITGRDVTEKKIVEEEREFDRNNLHALLNTTEDLIWSVDKNLRLITGNQQFKNFFKDFAGTSISERESVVLENNILFSHFTLGYRKILSGQSFTGTELAAEHWLEFSFYPIYVDKEIAGIACFCRDVTERKNSDLVRYSLEKKMREQKIQEQKKITRAVFIAQEKARVYLGRELHDNINQLLAATKLHLDMATKTNKEVKEKVAYSSELLTIAIEEIKLLSRREVVPTKNIDLQELSEKIVSDFEENTGIKTTFISNIKYKVSDDDLKLNLYRIIQENFNNIVKHANAKNVSVILKSLPGFIHLQVKDDGIGFDFKKNKKGIGIANIINRVELFNGKISIKTAPGKGCTTDVFIPLKKIS